MLVLSSLNKLLGQVLSPPGIHTVVLFTTNGELLSFASANPDYSKDDVLVLVGLGTEIWSETREDGEGMVDSEELGRVVVHPIASDVSQLQLPEPLVLVALNGNDKVEWGQMQLKAKSLAKHLVGPLAQLKGKLTSTPVQPVSKSSRVSR